MNDGSNFISKPGEFTFVAITVVKKDGTEITKEYEDRIFELQHDTFKCYSVSALCDILGRCFVDENGIEFDELEKIDDVDYVKIEHSITSWDGWYTDSAGTFCNVENETTHTDTFFYVFRDGTATLLNSAPSDFEAMRYSEKAKKRTGANKINLPDFDKTDDKQLTINVVLTNGSRISQVFHGKQIDLDCFDNTSVSDIYELEIQLEKLFSKNDKAAQDFLFTIVLLEKIEKITYIEFVQSYLLNIRENNGMHYWSDCLYDHFDFVELTEDSISDYYWNVKMSNISKYTISDGLLSLCAKEPLFDCVTVENIVFENKNFVTTGFISRDIEHYIEMHGGIVRSSTVLDTDYLVVYRPYGERTTKYKRAVQLIKQGKNIKIISARQFADITGFKNI